MKQVGIFQGDVDGPYPCWCEIMDDLGNKIRFTHRDVSDLEHLVRSMRRKTLELLPERDRGEV